MAAKLEMQVTVRYLNNSPMDANVHKTKRELYSYHSVVYMQ